MHEIQKYTQNKRQCWLSEKHNGTLALHSVTPSVQVLTVKVRSYRMCWVAVRCGAARCVVFAATCRSIPQYTATCHIKQDNARQRAAPRGTARTSAPRRNATKRTAFSVKAIFHYASLFGAGSELVRSQLRTSSESASIMEFGF